MSDERAVRLASTTVPWREDLFLVVQAGRAFQDRFPWARVVADHGRQLAVELTDAELRSLPVDEACFAVVPLQPGAEIVERLPPDVFRAAVRGSIATLVSSVSQAAYRDALTTLASHPTRHSLSAHFAAAAEWSRARLEALGYSVALQPIIVGAGSSVNVVAERQGAGPAPRGVVIVTAHLDSVNTTGGPDAPAPGADDNASGSAGVLEIARVLASVPAERDLRLILFGGEEQGLHGSRRYVSSLPAAERARIRAVVNMDMIATRNTEQPTVLLEGAGLSQAVMDALAAAAATYTSLRVERSLHPFASDHVPFIDAGIPAALTIEGADSANGAVHTAGDTLARIDYPLALEILRMNVAAVAGLLGLSPAGASLCGPAVSAAPNRIDVFVRGTDHAIHHRRWDGASWLPFVSLGGTCVSHGEAVVRGGAIDVFVLGTDRALYRRRSGSTVWERLGGTCIAGPRAAPDGTIYVLGTDHAVHRWNAGWTTLGGICVSAPDVVSHDGGTEVFVLGADRAVYRNRDAAAWERLGGVCVEGPRAVASADGQLDVFVVGTDSALYHWTSSSPAWARLGGVCASVPEAVSWGPGRLDVFVLGTDSALYHRFRDGGAWSGGFRRLGGVCASPPRAVSWGPGRLDVFVEGMDSALWHTWWDGGEWHGFESLGGTLSALRHPRKTPAMVGS